MSKRRDVKAVSGFFVVDEKYMVYVERGGYGSKLEPSQTMVVITDLDTEQSAVGLSRCSVHDEFNEMKAVKLAIQDAFENDTEFSVDKSKRTEFWNSYHNDLEAEYLAGQPAVTGVSFFEYLGFFDIFVEEDEE